MRSLHSTLALCVLTAAMALSSCAPREDERPLGAADAAADTSEPQLMQCFELAADATEREDWAAARDAYVAGMELAPNLPALMLAAAGAEARLGNTTDSLAILESVVRLGATANLEAEAAFAAVLDQPGFLDLATRLAANGEALPAAEVMHRCTDAELWPEGIAVDPTTGDLYVGSIKRRAIYRLTPAGALHELGASSEDGLLEVLGLWVDADRRALWAATGEGDYEEPIDGPPRKNELVRYDLEDGSLAQRFTVPDDELRLLNDVVVAPDGTAWATETLRGEVFRVRPGGKLELYTRFPELIYLNGIAISGDGRTLYLGHYGGLSAVDLEDDSLHPVRGENMALGMIDGLSWIDNQLVMVQNNRRVNFRVVRVALDADGRRAESLEVLPSGLPEGLIPYTCAVNADTVFVVAGAPFGLMEESEPPPAPAVVTMPLSPPAS